MTIETEIAAKRTNAVGLTFSQCLSMMMMIDDDDPAEGWGLGADFYF